MGAMKTNKIRKALIMISILLLVVVLIYSGLRLMESTVARQETGVTQEVKKRKTIVRNNVEYYPRLNVTIIMVAGIDETGPMTDSESYNNSGEADMVSLLIINKKTQQVDVISLNRDSMVNIPVLGLNGKPAGTIKGQLALAHTYGSGLEDSSKNLRTAVSDFLYGIDIDYYVTMNMDAIALLNDAVGGVTVNVTDDFSAVDPSIPMGEVTLTGEQAISYVRSRNGVGDQMNLTRMERQKEYMDSFLQTLIKKLEADTRFVSNVYQEVSPYVVTDCSTRSLANLLDLICDYQIGDIVTIDGENVKGKEFMEFHVDSDALDKVVLEFLYEPKKN